MGKEANKTTYIVRLKDGSEVVACCGPMIVALKDTTGYSEALGALECQRDAMPQSDFLDFACPQQRGARKKELEKNSQWPHPNSLGKGGTF